MARTYVVTGSASGIGRATCERLERDGHSVIDVDLRDASICVDLSTAAGRAALVDDVTAASGGAIDAIVANAGVMGDPGPCVRVNYFGAVATLEGLRPLLAGSAAPRAVATASSSVMNLPRDQQWLVDLCLAGDEEAAVAAAGPAGLMGYPSSKRALARWVRRQAPTADWAGAGIGLNAVAPGIVQTAMTEPMLDDDRVRPMMDAAVPMPYGGYCEPRHVAEVISFLASGDVDRLTGQVLFVDGGADAVLRGEDIW